MNLPFSTDSKKLPSLTKNFFWFCVGAFLGLSFLVSFSFIFFQKKYANTIYPGVYVNGVHFGGKTKDDVRFYFAQKNDKIGNTVFTFKKEPYITTISAKQLNFGYDEYLLSEQAYSMGRSKDLISNMSLVFQAYLNGINLSPAYHYSEGEIEKLLDPITKELYVEPTDALFTFENGKVVAFKLSSDGQAVDMETVKRKLMATMLGVVSAKEPQKITFTIPLKVIKPKITNEKANNLGITELIGVGTSLFQHSIESRIYNISLAATRLNGILVAPEETFSFDNALGDISAFTGYKQAYVIQNGKTVLGDGGGVCQVSTTFFRALLNAGLPITERIAHAYRVGYYEQDSPPGLDATIFVPSVDLKFKNDTGNYILIQTALDPAYERLTILLYGKKDGRNVTISTPVVKNQIPAPEASYQDDPTLQKGVVKQVDFSAAGATVVFTRQVTKNGKEIINEKYTSVYRPWQAVFLRGTKE